MKSILFGIIICLGVSSCVVQQHAINTEVEPFQNGGRLFGESTMDMKIGKDYMISHSLYVLGAQVMSDFETKEMVEKLEADKYTIQTKNSFIGSLCLYMTGGIVSGTKTTIYKREE